MRQIKERMRILECEKMDKQLLDESKLSTTTNNYNNSSNSNNNN